MTKPVSAKRSILLSVLAFVVLVATALMFALPAHADGTQSDTYSFVTANINAAPTDDFLHSTTAGDQKNTTREYDATAKEFRLKNTWGGAGDVNDGTYYLGGIFLVNPGVEYTDFTFELKFRATWYANDSRWMGIMYRMQTDENTGLHSGYMLTARVNGHSAYTSNAGIKSTANPSSNNGFNDLDTNGTMYTPFTDNATHTITIVMSGDKAEHYVDGTKLRDALTSAQHTNITPRDSGGFAIILNSMTVAIESCTITGNAVVPEPPQYSEAYTVTDFNEIAADDWKVSGASEAGSTKVSVNADGNLVINAPNSNDKHYFGALLPINPGSTYKNFTFEITVRANKSNGDDFRWMGVVYRTKRISDETPVSGYIMNYRLNGKNAYAAVNGSRSFSDKDEIQSGGQFADGTVAPVLLDYEYHTITITMENDAVAKHYFDGHLVREAATATHQAHLGATYTDGGFALIVNCMELCVKSCRIIPDEIVVPTPTASDADNTIVQTYQDSKVTIANAPTVVCDVTDSETLNSLAGTEKPSNAILRFNKDANVVGANGEVLGSFTDVYESLNHAIIPVLDIADDESADAVIDYLTHTKKILDIAVMSYDPALVKKVRSACVKTRGIIEYTAADFYTDDKLDIFNNIVAKSNINLAATVVIPQSVATIDNVRYIQARFKAVWVRPDDNTDRNVLDSITSGAYGIVEKDFGKVYDMLETFPRGTLTRMPFNVAHRGLFGDVNVLTENSLDAVQQAIDCGATHLELDGHMTSDGHIVIMHDDTLNRTTTGTGRIPDMTLAQVRQYKLRDGQEIPVLEQVFDLLYKAKQKGRDIVFVFELKTGSTIVQKIDSLLGTGEGQYDIRDNLVVITFNRDSVDLLADLKTYMPGTPTSHLFDSSSAGSFAANLADMGYYNCGLDTGYNVNNNPPLYDKQYRTDRGIAGWYWTFGDSNAVTTATLNGYMGLTNNAPTTLTGYVYKVEGAQSPVKDIEVGDPVAIKSYLYSSYTHTTTKDTSVAFCEETTGGWNVIAQYNYKNVKHFTQVFFVAKGVDVKIYRGETAILDKTVAAGGSVEFTAPTVAGYTFKGLYSDAQLTTPATIPAEITEDLVLYAKYDEEEVPPPVENKVDVVVNGSTVKVEIDADGSVKFTAPAVEGKHFVGLFVDAEYKTPATAENIQAGMTLYAKYEADAETPPPVKPDDKPDDKPGTTPSANSGKDGLSGGAIAGIVVGAVAVVAAAAVGVWLFLKRKKK